MAIEADAVPERVLEVTWLGDLDLAEDLALAAGPASVAVLVPAAGPDLVLHHSVARRRRCLVE